MTTIIYIFFIALLTSFFLTPLVRKAGLRFNIVDLPSERKIHTRPVPRIGGVALFLSFVATFVVLSFNPLMFEDLLASHERFPVFMAGAWGAFLLGLWDDFRSLPAWSKFAGQIAIGILVYFGGLQIHVVTMPFAEGLGLGMFSLPATVFWFVLVINAINLIDGLDGLAAGVSLFVSMAMLVICVNNNKITEALAFAALGGSLLGFLRYNFNPASIFMGDGGSYFLGYSIAALSIMGSIKGQVATAMLIPVIALGVPLIDAIWAPIRRFVLGKEMFKPDTGHLHHKLVKLGYTHRRVVLIIYGCTILLGGIAIVLVHANDETAALVLLVLGAVAVFLVNFLNTRERAGAFGISRWIYEISDASGITHDRRSFFNHQLLVAQSGSIEELWETTCAALGSLEIDEATLFLRREGNGSVTSGSGEETGMKHLDQAMRFSWRRVDHGQALPRENEHVLRLAFPLLEKEGKRIVHYGYLEIAKDLDRQSAPRFMLSRIEHLRQSMLTALRKIGLG